MLTSLTKGDGRVSQLLTIADKGGRGLGQPPPNMADIISEQSLIANKIVESEMSHLQIGKKLGENGN